MNPANPRYFTDGTGKAIMLAGSHTWATIFDQGSSDPPPPFNITQFCDFLKLHGHNFTRTFVWEQSRRGAWIPDTNYWFHPGPPFKRTGPGNAADGKPKFNLDSLDQNYFDWIKARVDTFYARGIYVSIQLFDGWSVAQPTGLPGNPWLDHPMNVSNNVNGIDGHNDLAGVNGEATQSLLNPALWPIQVRYIKKLVDELNAYDNVLYEISNESWAGSQDWQYRVIDTIKAYESHKPKQHPVGMTVEWPGGNNDELFASHADWISPNEAAFDAYDYRTSPPPSDGSKVIITDTDHLWGNGGDEVWVWKSFCRGLNVLYMDGYDGKAYGTGHPWTQADSANPVTVQLRKNLGYILRYGNRMNLVAMVPRVDLSSTGFCLANPISSGAEYLVYFPGGGTNTVDLSGSPGALNVEWFNPATGLATPVGTTTGGVTQSFTPPFSGNAVLYLFAGSTSPPETPTLVSPADGATNVSTTPAFSWNAAGGAISYRVQVATASDFSATVIDQVGITATTYNSSELQNSTTYYWRVSAANSAGSGAWSTASGFHTVPPPPPPAPPALISPFNGATEVPTDAPLSWSASPGARSYRLQVSIDGSFGTTLVDQANIVATIFAFNGLAANTTYYWRVSAANTGGTSAFSAAWSFTTSATVGLLAAYHFDEGSGTTVTDVSGNGGTGTISGATWTTQGRYGNALQFDGGSSYVDLGNSPVLQTTGSMTWSAWVKALADPPDDGQIMAKSDDGSGWQLKTSPDTGPHTFAVSVSQGNGSFAQRYSTTSRSLNTWYYIAGVFDTGARSLNIYVNGVPDNGVLSGTVPASQSVPNLNVNVGRRSGGYYFNGIIDEVRIYDRALTQAEIQLDMNTPLGVGAPAALVSPANGAIGVVTNPTLIWNASFGVTTYRVQVSNDVSFGTTLIDQSGITGTSFTFGGLTNGTVYYWRVDASNGGGLGTWSNTWSFTTQDVNSITLLQGWNIISSYVQPIDSSLDGICSHINPNILLLKNGSGGVYWPAFGVNTVGMWRAQYGYQIYMQSGDTLTVTGYQIQPQALAIPLVQNWNMVGYVRNAPMRADSALVSISSDASLIVKNNVGQVYWPAFGINTIGSMVPGQGYQVYVSRPTVLMYPSDNPSGHPVGATGSAAAVIPYPMTITGHYPHEFRNTGVNATLLVESGALHDGDELAAWTPRHALVGSGVLRNGKALLTVWGANTQVKQDAPGAAEGEELSLTAWSTEKRTEEPFAVESLTDALTGKAIQDRKMRYGTNAAIVVRGAVAKALPTTFDLSQNYPNPFNPATVIEFQIPVPTKVTLKVFDVLGRLVRTLLDEPRPAGSYSVEFNGAKLASGIYVYRLEAGSFIRQKKLLLLR